MAPWFSRLPRSAQFSGGDSGADRRIFLDSDNLFDLDLIFDVDSDNLFDLDLIFDVVRAETETHVVIDTRDVFRRMWCAGVITTAIADHVRVVIVRCDGYMHPDEAYKSAAAALCRYIKCMFAADFARISLNSDSLFDLVLLLDASSMLCGPRPKRMW